MFQLRPYQKESVDAVLAHFRKSRYPAVVVLPTGAGKSLVIAELARIAKGRVLVLTHVKELVEQNYEKFKSYGLEAGIYSAGLNRKDSEEKVIFGSIQSVARAKKGFFKDFSLLVIDECHRVNFEEDTQYKEVIGRLLEENSLLCILGLTATPYRLDSGWIYKFHYKGTMRTEEPKFFRKCLYELSLKKMIEDGYLTPPVQIDAPVASYDFSSLKLYPGQSTYRLSEIEEILKDQRRITPVIIKNIVDIARDRKGVIIFTASVRHAEEILEYLPRGEAEMVIGDTPSEERDRIVGRFKKLEIKYLVNVSVLTTGFDAPHVDLIAILRPTESVSLYQQIVGRGLRLYPGKKDCLVLDYTGVPHDIYKPVIRDDKPTEDSVPVEVSCPQCKHVNEFWGLMDGEGHVVEHFGRKCQGAIEDPDGEQILPCGFRYRFKLCDKCGAECDIAARECGACGAILVDIDDKLKEAMGEKNSHVMRPDSMILEKKVDAKGMERLEVRYYDLDAEFLSEVFFFNHPNDEKVFYYNFFRMHAKLPEKKIRISSIEEAIKNQVNYRLPLYVIARKQGQYWKIREKIFR